VLSYTVTGEMVIVDSGVAEAIELWPLSSGFILCFVTGTGFLIFNFLVFCIYLMWHGLLLHLVAIDLQLIFILFYFFVVGSK
jgi:hypothetical protein